MRNFFGLLLASAASASIASEQEFAIFEHINMMRTDPIGYSGDKLYAQIKEPKATNPLMWNDGLAVVAQDRCNDAKATDTVKDKVDPVTRSEKFGEWGEDATGGQSTIVGLTKPKMIVSKLAMTVGNRKNLFGESGYVGIAYCTDKNLSKHRTVLVYGNGFGVNEEGKKAINKIKKSREDKGIVMIKDNKLVIRFNDFKPHFEKYKIYYIAGAIALLALIFILCCLGRKCRSDKEEEEETPVKEQEQQAQPNQVQAEGTQQQQQMNTAGGPNDVEVNAPVVVPPTNVYGPDATPTPMQ